MTKEELLHELNNETWVMIKPSGIHGIGVFAVRDIPKGARGFFSKGIGGWVELSHDEVEALPEHSKYLIHTYCLFDEEKYWVPDYGFKVMDISLYLNHAEPSNVISINHGEDFETTRDIKAGEELLINYGEIVDSDE
ncbi:MAG: SET domain-containing protein-lysine N-methyltransferase [Sphingobacteriales bacterium]|nr:SET domain-containing protein-lysine N-methyltransferase [Sphingobacteriales bacterium]MBI3718778.1 SET domain-containing protein-lysine N-methyltransferase [Sphingobacteriales bacterium]